MTIHHCCWMRERRERAGWDSGPFLQPSEWFPGNGGKAIGVRSICLYGHGPLLIAEKFYCRTLVPRAACPERLFWFYSLVSGFLYGRCRISSGDIFSRSIIFTGRRGYGREFGFPMQCAGSCCRRSRCCPCMCVRHSQVSSSGVSCD